MIPVVDPQPPNQEGAQAAHVFLIQNPQDALSTSLITGFDNGQRQEGPSFQLASATNEQFLLDHVILGLGLTARCFPPGVPMQCMAHSLTRW